MAIETLCTGCGQRLRVPDEHAGRTARCPQCRTLYTVPKPAGSAPLPDIAQLVPSRMTGMNPGEPPPAAISPTDMYYVKTEGRSFGPITGAELLVWQSEGRLPPEALVQREGWAPLPANALFALSQPASAAAASPAFGEPSIPRFSRAGKGNLVLILGIASLGSYCSCGAVAPLFAVTAIVLAIIELQKTSVEPISVKEQTFLVLGLVLGLISLAVLVGYVVLLVQ